MGTEWVEHVLLRCDRIEAIRKRLKDTVVSQNLPWLPESGILITRRILYAEFCRFSKDALYNREDQRA